MEKFTSSTGLVVSLDASGIRVKNPADQWDFGSPNDAVQAMREFFLHERDQELGRWRFNAYLTVYEAENHQPGNRARAVNVLDERTGRLHMRHEGQAAWRETNPELSEAAAAYFAAHPEPKPWHEAKHNEIWVLQIKDCHAPEPYRFAQDTTCADSCVFRPVSNPKRVFFDSRSPMIVDAHRIYPEASDE